MSKSKDDESNLDGFIPPNSFDKSFDELGIKSGAQLVVIEIKNMENYQSDDEGQEDEFEEMEEEFEEGDVGGGLTDADNDDDHQK